LAFVFRAAFAFRFARFLGITRTLFSPRFPLPDLASVCGCGANTALGSRFGLGCGMGASVLPPAASIAARAPLLTATPTRVTLRVSLPETITFALLACPGTTPASFNTARSIFSALTRSRSDSSTSAVSSRVRELKPRLGSLR